MSVAAGAQHAERRSITAAALITTLGKARYENRFDERLKILTQPKLPINDEIGYIPIDRQGANLFFQLVSRATNAPRSTS